MSSPVVSLAFHLQMLMPLLRRFLPISQGVALGWGLIAPSVRYRMHADDYSQRFMANYMKFMDNYMVILCFLLLYVVLCCSLLFDLNF